MNAKLLSFFIQMTELSDGYNLFIWRSATGKCGKKILKLCIKVLQNFEGVFLWKL